MQVHWDHVANLQSYFSPSSLVSALVETKGQTDVVSEGIEKIGRK
mgnify:CR=1 FL=1